ncbi:MAG: hypothetical protein WCK86_18990, partial [Planctomycetia bacterium]
MTSYRLALCWVLGLVVFSVAARADEAANEAGNRLYETHIRPVLARRCYACHSEKAGKREG